MVVIDWQICSVIVLSHKNAAGLYFIIVILYSFFLKIFFYRDLFKSELQSVYSEDIFITQTEKQKIKSLIMYDRICGKIINDAATGKLMGSDCYCN